ncbi:MAG: hypothetical protein K2X27_03925 [Candidatus Obscuribacterales bacterium]|nr:hypothetical protein [Candidatus Obscuribacterales bacterium]
MSVKRLAILLSILTVFTGGGSGVEAKKSKASSQNSQSTQDYSSLSAASGAFGNIDPELLDPMTAYLLWQTSSKPELMNLEYLRYFLGNPAKQTSQIGVRSHAYYWYTDGGLLRCELYQEHDQPGQVIESIFRVNLPPSDLDFKTLNNAVGMPARSYFDHDGHPNQMYSFAPNTSTSFATPANAFCVRKANVTYLGPPLSTPSPQDMQTAHDAFVARTYGNAGSQTENVNWADALSLARERVKEHPNDAEAHASLAEVLKRTGNVHESIDHYKMALSLNKYNDAIQSQCIQGLKDLYVLPQNYGIDQNAGSGVASSRPLQFSHSTQKLRVAGSGGGSN